MVRGKHVYSLERVFEACFALAKSLGKEGEASYLLWWALHRPSCHAFLLQLDLSGDRGLLPWSVSGKALSELSVSALSTGAQELSWTSVGGGYAPDPLLGALGPPADPGGVIPAWYTERPKGDSYPW